MRASKGNVAALSWRVASAAAIVGIGAVAVASAIGYSTHLSTLETAEVRLRQQYLDTARALANRALAHTSPEGAVEAVEAGWAMSRVRSGDAYVSVIDADGRVISHSARPNLIGVDASKNRVLGDDSTSHRSLGTLVASGDDYVGGYLTKAGEEQLAAFAPVRVRGWTIGVHRSKADLHAEIEAGVREQLIGLVAVGLLIPLSLGALFVAFVSARRRWAESESKLREETYFVDRLVETADAIIVVLDQDARIVFFNRFLAELSGFDLDEVRQKDWFETFIPEDERSRIRERFRGVTDRQDVHGAVNAIQLADGQRREILWSGTPLENEAGDLTGVVSVGWDITERLKAEANLARSEARMRAILDTAIDGIVSIDDRGVIETWNGGAERMFGYAANEIVGKNVSVLMPQPHAQDHDGYLARFSETGEAKIIGVGREVRGRRKDGATFPLDLGVGEMFVGGKRRFTGVLRDVTVRKAAEEALAKSERRLSTLLSNVPGLVYRALNDEHRTMKLVSAHAVDVTGYTPDELVDNRLVAFGDLIEHDDREYVRGTVQRALRRGDPFFLEYRIRTKTGEVRWVRERGVRVAAEDGGLDTLEGIIADITKEKQAEDDKQRLEEQLRQSQKLEAIGTLTSGVAHDYNNLLMGISGCTDLASRKLEDEHPSRVYLDEIKRAAGRGASLTRQLLTFSRRRELKVATVDIDQVLAAIENMIRSLLGETIELKMSLGASKILIDADAGQLEQVVMNLAVNAKDAMPGGGQLVIETLPHDSESGREVVLRVRDSGIGIDPDTQRRVFEPFFTTKAVGEGTGLGLATVFGIVKTFGGRIDLESKVGTGTTFTICLPEKKVMDPVDAVEPSPQIPRGGTETILLVEDDPLVRVSVRTYLESAGYETLEACDGHEAFMVTRQHSGVVDGVVTDVMLPGSTGLEVAQEVSRITGAANVLYMSAHARDVLRESGRIPENARFLQKPFAEADLLMAVAAMFADG